MKTINANQAGIYNARHWKEISQCENHPAIRRDNAEVFLREFNREEIQIPEPPAVLRDLAKAERLAFFRSCFIRYMQEQHLSNFHSVVTKVYVNKNTGKNVYRTYAQPRYGLACDMETRKVFNARRKPRAVETKPETPSWEISYVNPLTERESVAVIQDETAEAAEAKLREQFSKVKRNRRGQFCKPLSIIQTLPARTYDPATVRQHPGFIAAFRRVVNRLAGAGIYFGGSLDPAFAKLVSFKPRSGRCRGHIGEVLEQLESDCNLVHCSRTDRRNNPFGLAGIMTINHFTRRAGDRQISRHGKVEYVSIVDAVASADERTGRGKHARHGGNVQTDPHGKTDFLMDWGTVVAKAQLSEAQYDTLSDFVAGRSYADIAEREGLSRQAIAKRMKAIIHRLTDVKVREGKQLVSYY